MATDLTALSDPIGTMLGVSDQVSAFQITRDGQVVGGGSTGTTYVLPANNVVFGQTAQVPLSDIAPL